MDDPITRNHACKWSDKLEAQEQVQEILQDQNIKWAQRQRDSRKDVKR